MYSKWLDSEMDDFGCNLTTRGKISLFEYDYVLTP